VFPENHSVIYRHGKELVHAITVALEVHILFSIINEAYQFRFEMCRFLILDYLRCQRPRCIVNSVL